MKKILLVLGRNNYSKFNEFVNQIDPSISTIECSFEKDIPEKYQNNYLSIPIGKELKTIIEYCKNKEVVGVVNTKDQYEVLHGQLVDQFNVPGPSFHSVDQIGNKANMQQLIEDLQLNLFRPTTICCQLSEVSNLLKSLQFPVVIKPFSGAHSRGVHKLNSQEDFEEIYPNLYKHFSQMKNKKDQTVLIEEHISGKQVAPVCYVDGKSKVHLLSLVKCITAQDLKLPHLQIIYRTTPSNFSEEILNKIKFVLQKIAKATQLRNTFLDPEFIIKKNNVYLIEINVRLGGFRKKLIQDAYGINLHQLMTELALNQEIDDSFASVSSATACEIWENNSGKIKNIKIPNSKFITSSKINIGIGEEYLAPPNGNRALGTIFLKTKDKSLSKMKSLREKVMVEIE
jgi:biotin carboxylase